MLNLLKFAMAIVMLAGWGLAAMSLHIVRTADTIKLIPKNELTVADTYVDVRQWTRDDEQTHPLLFARLKQLDLTTLLTAATDKLPKDTLPTAVATSSSKTHSGDAIADTWYRINRSRH